VGAGMGMHACRQVCVQSMWYIYANVLSFVIACIVFLFMKIFVCLIKQASLLAIISQWGVDNSTLWLSFLLNKNRKKFFSALQTGSRNVSRQSGNAIILVPKSLFILFGTQLSTILRKS
jgi:hypothetical protein